MIVDITDVRRSRARQEIESASVSLHKVILDADRMGIHPEFYPPVAQQIDHFVGLVETFNDVFGVENDLCDLNEVALLPPGMGFESSHISIDYDLWFIWNGDDYVAMRDERLDCDIKLNVYRRRSNVEEIFSLTIPDTYNRKQVVEALEAELERIGRS